ncbi:hypothetical protein [Aeromonas salmonicida]|uniref:hypothetical protein n=1 Tax=Aeromonas salmonicida TaxID=645 RepID=UPI0038B941B8
MDLATTIGVVGSIASIISLVLAAKTVKQRFIHFGYGIIIFIFAGVAVHFWQENQRIHQIENSARSLVESRDEYSESGFAQATLAFLEKNKDLYPDTYARAQMLCEKNDCFGAKYGSKQKDSLDHAYNQIDVASAMQGILRSIGKLERD